MAMAYCYSLIKYVLSFLNIIFLTLGVGAVSFASWVLWEGRGRSGNGEAGLDSVVALGAVVAWGLALAVSALLALAGVVRRGRVRLGLAGALLSLLVVAETAALWWGATHVPQLRIALRERLTDMVQNEYGLVDSTTQVIDAIQQELHCCGAEGPRDYRHSTWVKSQARRLTDELTATEGPAIDLTVSAPAEHLWVPASCCSRPAACGRVARAGGAGGAAVRGEACAPRALGALERGAGAGAAALAALLAAQAAALLLAAVHYAALRPADHYKA